MKSENKRMISGLVAALAINTVFAYEHSGEQKKVKRVAFSMVGTENVTIDGQGFSFIFHGSLNPFILDRAKNITLKNFRIMPSARMLIP